MSKWDHYIYTTYDLGNNLLIQVVKLKTKLEARSNRCWPSKKSASCKQIKQF